MVAAAAGGVGGGHRAVNTRGGNIVTWHSFILSFSFIHRPLQAKCNRSGILSGILG